MHFSWIRSCIFSTNRFFICSEVNVRSTAKYIKPRLTQVPDNSNTSIVPEKIHTFNQGVYWPGKYKEFKKMTRENRGNLRKMDEGNTFEFAWNWYRNYAKLHQCIDEINSRSGVSWSRHVEGFRGTAEKMHIALEETVQLQWVDGLQADSFKELKKKIDDHNTKGSQYLQLWR